MNNMLVSAPFSMGTVKKGLTCVYMSHKTPISTAVCEKEKHQEIILVFLHKNNGKTLGLPYFVL